LKAKLDLEDGQFGLGGRFIFFFLAGWFGQKVVFYLVKVVLLQGQVGLGERLGGPI